MPRYITLPKWDGPLISQKRANFDKISNRSNKAQHKYVVCKPINSYLITQVLASKKHNIYKHMQGTKQTHAKGKVTFNENELSTCYRKEEHWI